MFLIWIHAEEVRRFALSEHYTAELVSELGFESLHHFTFNTP